ncbi:MAG: DNA/RNA nuclease SfsA [Clostridia bacterium]|nr:DNA/RNA nuclease SfsA [Clostridia bacterium]
MKYSKIVKGKFLSRTNRFVANVEINGSIEVVHVKNTGRCKELLIEGSTVLLEDCENLNRKTRYDLVAVYKEGFGLINIDSQAPNKVVYEWLLNQGYELVKSEYKYGESRIDFYMEKDNQRYLMEIKGCTLEIDGEGYFPDAPTERGTKHLRELTRALSEGYKAILGFVIQMDNISIVHPNSKTDPTFATEYEKAVQAGVEVKLFKCHIQEDGFEIVDEKDLK